MKDLPEALTILDIVFRTTDIKAATLERVEKELAELAGEDPIAFKISIMSPIPQGDMRALCHLILDYEKTMYVLGSWVYIV